jgi:hypothetical protein
MNVAALRFRSKGCGRHTEDYVGVHRHAFLFFRIPVEPVKAAKIIAVHHFTRLFVAIKFGLTGAHACEA